MMIPTWLWVVIIAVLAILVWVVIVPQF